MQYNLINSRSNTNMQINRFLGLNRKDKCNEGEFADMNNLSSDKFPCLSPSKHNLTAFYMEDIRAVIAPKITDDSSPSFTGVAGDRFYYNGTKIDNMVIPASGDVTLVDFNGRIIICVYTGSADTSVMYYYDYTATEDGTVKNMEKGVYNITCSASSKGDPDEDAEIENCITSSGRDWTKYFNVGDAVFIEGFENDENNTLDIDSKFKTADKSKPVSCIVEKIDGNKLYIQMYNYLGERLVLTKETVTSKTDEETGATTGVSIYIKIPTMNHICVHCNRLWGTNPNGEYVYASKQGDCFNFSTFQGLANDSFYSEIGTPGGFVGIVSYRDNLVAFKRDYIHHIYGDKPSNYTIPKQLSDCGCIDIKSAVQVGSVLYFLGYNGFYAYTGGQPELISDKLDMKYTSAVGMTDGVKYIVSTVSAIYPYETEMLVYDTRYGLWHMENSYDLIGSFRWHDELYMATEDKVYIYGGGIVGPWSCVSGVINESAFDNKAITELWIRAKIKDGRQVEVYTSEDGGDFLSRGTLKGTGTLKVYRVPVRFINGDYYQYKLEGNGDTVIHDIERVTATGGRNYRKG